MKCPKIITAKTIDDHTLLVEFDNQKKKKQDISPLLKNGFTFKPVQ